MEYTLYLGIRFQRALLDWHLWSDECHNSCGQAVYQTPVGNASSPPRGPAVIECSNDAAVRRVSSTLPWDATDSSSIVRISPSSLKDLQAKSTISHYNLQQLY